ncbi:MAG: murein transglycosylase A [Alphaproteobacteria bacterium]
MRSSVLVAGALSALSACAPAPDRLVLIPAEFSELSGWSAGAQAGTAAALRRSCESLSRLPDSRPVGHSSIGARAGAWRGPCRALGAVARTDHSALRGYFERWFAPYRVASARSGETGLFTGYFEPGLRGARQRTRRFNVPLYRRPPELAPRSGGGVMQRIASRSEIADGALAGRGLELVWVDSVVDAFFLHVQGSGRVRLPDGAIMRVGFAGRNGHPYRSIGKELINRGAVSAEDVTMQSIRAWLLANPLEAKSVMAVNASYVFFREIAGDGPIGSQGVALISGRSLAVDRRYLPLGAPIWLETTDPLGDNRPLRRLMVAQDTGSAIKGIVRGDVFWGHGAQAALRAGRMKQSGRYFLLLPRTIRPQSID